MATASGSNGTTVFSNAVLKIGNTTIHNVDIVQSRIAVSYDAAGLLPASLFRRIYISHSGDFIIFNPVD
jgi:hypothetical protein